RSLMARGGGRIHGSDVTDRAPALYKVDQAHVLPHGSRPEFVDRLLTLCAEAAIDLVIPTIDPDLEFLSLNRERIARARPSLRLLLPPASVVEICRDKRRSRDAFAALGAEVPIAVDPDDPALRFPVFMKPPHGSAGEGARIVRDADDLAAGRRQFP